MQRRKLTALRYPEREFVSVAARQMYCEPAKPFLPVEQSSLSLSAPQQLHDDILDAQDVLRACSPDSSPSFAPSASFALLRQNQSATPFHYCRGSSLWLPYL
jgi:hypothetical protein